MPDTPIEPPVPASYPPSMEARVATLERIARANTAAFERVERRIDALERRFDSLATEQRADFRWLIGIMLGGFGTMLGGFGATLAIMAHGFHWF
jgi:hypothetical protein